MSHQDQLADILATPPESKGMASARQFAIDSLSKMIIEDKGIDCKAETETEVDPDFNGSFNDYYGVSEKTFY